MTKTQAAMSQDLSGYLLTQVGFSGTHKDKGPPKMVSRTHTIPISIRDSYGNSMGPKKSHYSGVCGNLTDQAKMPSLIFLPVVIFSRGEKIKAISFGSAAD